MSSYDLLSVPIKKYVRDKQWESLRPIQDAAIQRILTTDENYILASRTASGKTEAAFLPILSKVNFNEPGVQVLYISPLIALINDQFLRVEALCKYLEVDVTKWHGEANRTAKEHLLKRPAGIVLITPESLEAMFVNKTYHVTHLFSNLKYVVVDEIHSFIGSDRGTQLKSLLSRLQDVNTKAFNIVGLSATIGDYEQAKKFTGNSIRTRVLLDKTSKEINTAFRYYESTDGGLPLSLLKDLYTETKDNKVLIFPNSRGRTEEIAVSLKKIASRVKGHPNYFSHHSSVDKELREYVEYFAKNNDRRNFCIACTSTLELGIDIGTVDEVVQIDATHSIASLIQRVGRSGRKEGAASNLFLYATDKWSLLQSLACWLLYKEGFIEPPQELDSAYDILLHQALSITRGHSGIDITTLKQQLKYNFAFKDISDNDIAEIIDHLIEIDFLEKLQQEVIIGVEGEKVVNSREFYSVFSMEDNFKVVHSGNKIGELPFSPQIKEDENLFLAAKIWKITFVDFKSKKIEVVPAKDGKKPKFSGGGGIVHSRIREKMAEVLFSQEIYEELNDISAEVIEEMRRDFSIFNLTDIQSQRPLLVKENKLELYTFTGTKVNRTLRLLIDIMDINIYVNESSSCLQIFLSKEDFLKQWNLLPKNESQIKLVISQFLEGHPETLSTSKWGTYLPPNFQIKLMLQKHFDVKETVGWILRINEFVLNTF